MRVQLKTKIIFLLSIICLQRLLYSQYPEAPEKWSIPEKVLAISNNLFRASYPYLSSDGSALYFNGVTVTFWTDTGWSIPQNLNSLISSNLARRPCISVDGKNLYFTKFINGWDLYEAEWSSILNDWINIQFVQGGINVNSSNQDCGCLPNDTTMIFFRNSRSFISYLNRQNNLWSDAIEFPVPYLAFHSDHGMYVTEDMKKVYYVHARTDIDRYGQYYFNYDLIIRYKDTTNPTGYGLPKTLNISTLSDSGHFAGIHDLRFEGYPTVSRNGRMMYFAADYDSQLTIYSSRMIIDENGDSVTNIDEVIEQIDKDVDYFLPPYPNPSNNELTIDFILKISSGVVFKIFDVLGRELEVVNIGFTSAGKQKINFKFEEYQSGIYFVQMITSEEIYIQKFILLK